MVPNVIVYRYNPGREPKLDFQQERTGPSGSVDRLANMNRTLFLPSHSHSEIHTQNRIREMTARSRPTHPVVLCTHRILSPWLGALYSSDAITQQGTEYRQNDEPTQRRRQPHRLQATDKLNDE